MKCALAVFLFAGVAFGQEYSVGSVKPYRDVITTTTAQCSSIGTDTTCGTSERNTDASLYAMTFAEGYTRLLTHAAFSRDPLKRISGVTTVKYRIWRHAGINYVRVLDNEGKEGVYLFATRDDDPARIAKQRAKEQREAPAPAAP